MGKYKVEIDDGDGNIHWLDVEAGDENGASDAARRQLAELDSEADSDLFVVITIELA